MNKSILKKNKIIIHFLSITKNCNLTVNKSKDTKVEAYTCRYSSEPLIPNSATASLFIKVVYPVSVTEVRLCCIYKIDYNSLNDDKIYPKINSRIHL